MPIPPSKFSHNSPGGGRDDWFDRFLDDLEAGRLERREDLESRYREIAGEDWGRVEILWRSRPGAAGPPASGREAAEGERYLEWKEIGRGGMGIVYEAWDSLLERPVALKVLPILQAGSGNPGSPPSSRVEGFLDEARLTAQLDHPGIVPVHDLVSDRDGRLYYAMRRVRGKPLSEIFNFARERADGWTMARAVGVLAQVCQTAAFAHDRGIVHRDLKPGNIMVGDFGEVYVLDWGLARLGASPGGDLPSRIPSAGGARETGPFPEDAVLGTPSYMALEQARGEPHPIDGRADVYSVGAMLYSLLAGAEPYSRKDRRPSRREVIENLLAGPPAPILAANPNASAELVSICNRAMARDREERYASCLELADDLRAWMEHRVVRAHPAGIAARLRKWIERNLPLAATAAAAMLIFLIGLAGVSIFFFGVKSRQAEELAGREAHSRRYLAAARMHLAHQAIKDSRRGAGRRILESLGPANDAANAGYFDWRYLNRLLRTETRSYEGMRGAVQSLACHSGSGLLLGAGKGGALVAWRLGDSSPCVIQDPGAGKIAGASITPSGFTAVLLWNGVQHSTLDQIRLFQFRTDPERWEYASEIHLPGPAYTFALAPRADRMLVSLRDGRLLAFNLAGPEDGVVLGEFASLMVPMVFPASPRRLVARDMGGTLRQLDPSGRTSGPVFSCAADFAGLAVDPSGTRLAVPPSDGGLAILDADCFEVLKSIPAGRPDGPVAFLPGGERVAFAIEADVEVWDWQNARKLRRLGSHPARVTAIHPLGDDRRIATGCESGEVKLWDLEEPEEPRARICGSERYENLWTIRQASGAEHLLARRRPSVLERFDLGALRSAKEPPASLAIALDIPPDQPLDVSPDGRCIAYACGDRGVRLLTLSWDAEPPSAAPGPELAGAPGNLATAVAFSADGRFLAAAGPDQARTWRRRDGPALAFDAGRTITGLPQGGGEIDQLALSPSGRYLAVARRRVPAIFLWDAGTGVRLVVLQHHADWILQVAFSPDEKRLVSSSRDGTAALWEIPASPSGFSPAPLKVLSGHSSAVTGAVFLNGGNLIATASDDCSLKLWDPVTAEERLTLGGHRFHINALAYAPSADMLISAGGRKYESGEMFFWDAARRPETDPASGR